MKFLFAGILAFCISCVFSIEIDQNIGTDSDLPENQEDSDVSFGKYNFKLWNSKLIKFHAKRENFQKEFKYFLNLM